MARLFIQTDTTTANPRELNWGITRVGRGADNDIVIDHASVSYHHCELELGSDFLAVRDSGSTNGTFIDNQPVKEARLEPGQTLRFGQVSATVEWSRDQINVPKLEAPKLAASVSLGDGVLSCLKHEAVAASWHCPKCDQYFCGRCIHDVHLVGRPSRRTCPDCGVPVELAPWAGARLKKQSLWGRIKKTFSRTMKMR
jgi:pSer/pThr/pTyr-binding forkhead associated (FHA) protein